MKRITIIGAVLLITITLTQLPKITPDRERPCNRMTVDLLNNLIICEWRRNPIETHRCPMGIQQIEGTDDEFLCKRITNNLLFYETSVFQEDLRKTKLFSADRDYYRGRRDRDPVERYIESAL